MLPILESLSLNESFRSTNKQYGRAPSVVVLVPTRELANQVRIVSLFVGVNDIYSVFVFIVLYHD